MVQARVEAFEPPARRVLRAASVFGQVFWRGAVVALMGDEPCDDWLAELTSREAITRRNEARFAGEVEYIFRHTLLRDAAYATLTEGDGALGHRLAAEWLERSGEPDAMTLADHFERGRDAMRAVGWYLRAAAQALEGNDLVAVIARCDRAVACGAKGEDYGTARAMQTEAMVWRGDPVGALSAGAEATATLLRGSTTWWQAMAHTAIAAVRCADVPRAREIAVDVETMLRATATLGPTEVGAASRVARYLCFMGETHHTATLLGLLEPRAAIIAAGDPGCAAHWYASRALYAGVLGDLSTSLDLERAATEAYGLAGDRRGMWHSCINVGCGYAALGAYEQSEATLREAVAMANAMDLAGSTLTARMNLGLAVARRGALEEGCAIERAALEALKGPGHDHQILVFAHVYMATLLAEQGDLARAEIEASAAVERATDVPTLVCPAMAIFASVALARGRAAEALEAATLAYDLLIKLGGIEEGEAFVRLTYAQALRAAGHDAEGCTQIAAARARLLSFADKIADPTFRASFLERVPENARTMALATAWVGDI